MMDEKQILVEILVVQERSSVLAYVAPVSTPTVPSPKFTNAEKTALADRVFEEDSFDFQVDDGVHVVERIAYTSGSYTAYYGEYSQDSYPLSRVHSLKRRMIQL